MSKNRAKGSIFVSRNSRQVRSRTCFKVITCFAIQQNEKREKKRKSSNANNTLFIYNLSATLESFLMLWCTIWISSHDLTHHQLNSLSIQPRHIIWRCNTSVHFLIKLNFAATTCRFLRVSQRLRLSIPLFLWHHLQISPFIPKFLHIFQCGDNKWRKNVMGHLRGCQLVKETMSSSVSGNKPSVWCPQIDMV
jgi:hypothetical protein